MQQCQDPRLSRFGKKSKELLVDFINYKNNRLLSPTQLKFGNPVLVNETGLSRVEIQFEASTGWSDEKKLLTYIREDLNQILHDKPLVIHVTEDSDAAIIAAMKEQYGILIEPELVTIELQTRDFVGSAEVTDLGGFESADSEVDPTEPLPPALDDRNYVMTFKPEHLIFFGDVKIFTRRSITLLGVTIDSVLNLREFYSDGRFGKSIVDLIIPHGVLEVAGQDPATVRAYNSALYEIKADTAITTDGVIVELLNLLFPKGWHSTWPEASPFNLYGSKVLYNGFVNKDYTVCNPAFNYVIAIELGALCANLAGVIKIAYRYANTIVPSNLEYDRSAVLPLFSH